MSLVRRRDFEYTIKLAGWADASEVEVLSEVARLLRAELLGSSASVPYYEVDVGIAGSDVLAYISGEVEEYEEEEGEGQ